MVNMVRSTVVERRYFIVISINNTCVCNPCCFCECSFLFPFSIPLSAEICVHFSEKRSTWIMLLLQVSVRG